jgi:hypothetical protein
MKKQHWLLVVVVLLTLSLVPALSGSAAGPTVTAFTSPVGPPAKVIVRSPLRPPTPVVVRHQPVTRTVVTKQVNPDVGDETYQFSDSGFQITKYYAKYSLDNASMDFPPIVHVYSQPSQKARAYPVQVPAGSYQLTDGNNLTLDFGTGELLVRPAPKGLDLLYLVKVRSTASGDSTLVVPDPNGLATIRFVIDQ